jgi:hypothetical protein
MAGDVNKMRMGPEEQQVTSTEQEWQVARDLWHPLSAQN